MSAEAKFLAPASPLLLSSRPDGSDDRIANDEKTAAARKEAPFASEMKVLDEKGLSVVVIGASGHLARTKTYPALYALYKKGLLPKHSTIVGFARSKMKGGDEEFRGTIKLPKEPLAAEFLKKCTYFSGEYDKIEAFTGLHSLLEKAESTSRPGAGANRVFYLAIPPSVFADASKSLRAGAFSKTGWNRIVVEKPFGRDSDTSAELSRILLGQFSEDQIYRIDHYLGKEMVQNLMVLRFANTVFEPVWNRHHIQCVLINFKEDAPVEGRGGYFDEFGIIRDIMQNHLLQILSLVAMEPPVTLAADDVRNEKVKVLKAIPTLTLDKLIIGQYQGDAAKKVAAYPDDPSVKSARPAGAGPSLTPTFASAVLYIRNSRWDGVPFILRCGKGLNERKAEVRIQFRKPPGMLFEREPGVNELVLRVQPNEAIYLKTIAKTPGLSTATEQAELDLTYKSRFNVTSLPDAYERLLLDVLRGDHNLFVRNDELEVAWRIFTPVLHRLEREAIRPLGYAFGSRGPEIADKQAAAHGFVFQSGQYKWTEHAASNKSPTLPAGAAAAPAPIAPLPAPATAAASAAKSAKSHL